MELIPLVYIVLMPLLIIGSVLLIPTWRITCTRVMAVINLLLLWNAIYRIRLLAGMIQLFKSLGLNQQSTFQLTDWLNKPMLHFMGSIILPFLFLIPYVRNAQWTSLLMQFFVLSYFVWTDQDFVQIIAAICYVISLFAATYSLLWITRKLPFQKLSANG